MNHGPNPRAVLGANNPPEPTPFELSEREISDLYDEAKNWLDGEPVLSKERADMVGLLAQKVRAAFKTADERRVIENKPADEHKAVVQAKYAPLISNTKTMKGKAVLALEMCMQALAPWLAQEEAAKRAVAEAARQAAEAKARAAAEAMAAARQAADLEAREAAERAAVEAKKADNIARRAEKDTAKASGGAGRAIGLRTVYRAEITDLPAVVWHFLANCPDEVRPLIQRLVDDAVRSAGQAAGGMSIPGVVIHTEKKAV